MTQRRIPQSSPVSVSETGQYVTLHDHQQYGGDLKGLYAVEPQSFESASSVSYTDKVPTSTALSIAATTDVWATYGVVLDARAVFPTATTTFTVNFSLYGGNRGTAYPYTQSLPATASYSYTSVATNAGVVPRFSAPVSGPSFVLGRAKNNDTAIYARPGYGQYSISGSVSFQTPGGGDPAQFGSLSYTLRAQRATVSIEGSFG